MTEQQASRQTAEQTQTRSTDHSSNGIGQRTCRTEPQTEPEGKRRYRAGKIRDRNRNLIIDAAKQEFALNGYRGTTMQKVADRAGLAKANVHYYFRSKETLYTTVLSAIIRLWNEQFNDLRETDDPAQALAAIIQQKVKLAYTHPRESRLFAMEIIQGAPHINDYLDTEVRPWVEEKAGVIRAWIAAGKMRDLDPVQLIFLIWSSTQHYADFETQILKVTNRTQYDASMMEQVAQFLTQTILAGCGLSPPSPTPLNLD